MRHILSLGVFFTLICLSSKSFAQPPARTFTPDVITVSGVVVQEEEVIPERRMGAGMMIILATSEGQFIVHLGPERYLEQVGLRVAENDFLKVTGKLIRQPSRVSIIALEVEKDGNVFKLREHGNFPMWEQPVRY